ncbi:glycosyltransferase 87 family protein [Yinghuangia sp. ASG 101]|uniref:glycosyltransferase family 87 protein n=1 Tax=Yinghuangia sp. ASG 101 TaxID=2896848 RepID=UPI001E2A94C3|nr:glycosyltransferase 87 family protein [Yinghuangia sp. ASG 101]UGQ15477.1 glycosyltransferase 87 family protein [Yinghuangia sp. ASG 101]
MPNPSEPVLPSRDDPVVRAGSEVVGGPAGKRVRFGAGGSWWNLTRVLILLAVVTFALGLVQKKPCYDGGWFGVGSQYSKACYSDMPHLYQGRGFADGAVPYFDKTGDEGMEYLEYPVITGGVMYVAGSVARVLGDDITDEKKWFVMVNALIMMACAVVVVVAVARTSGRRPWDAAMVAAAPVLALNGIINWDMVAVALTAVAMMAWARRNVVLAGVLLGLATAAKLYPVLLLGPLFLLCLRAGRLPAFAKATGAAIAAWLAVNLPIMIFAWDGWKLFYTFSQERGADFGSLWLILGQRFEPMDIDTLNTWVTGLLLLMAAGIAALALCAPRRPRFAQLAFLIVAAFLFTNKVYSPQYVLWLLPLVVLARPRWRDVLIWQACEVIYFLGVWLYIESYAGGEGSKGLSQNAYQVAIMIHLVGLLYIAALVVRDILRPEYDSVRGDGSDDPAGGVLDHADDKLNFVPGQYVNHYGFHGDRHGPYAGETVLGGPQPDATQVPGARRGGATGTGDTEAIAHQ